MVFPMTDLINALRAQVAFDPVDFQAVERLLHPNKVSITLIDLAMEAAAKDANARLATLLSKLIAVVEAADNWQKQVDTYGGDYLPGNYKQIAQALADLRAAVGMGKS